MASSGTVKSVLSDKEFGFITPSEGLPPEFSQKDVYFNFKILRGSPVPDVGDQVNFLLFSNDQRSFERPSARKLWKAGEQPPLGNLKASKKFSSTQSLDQLGLDNTAPRTRRSSVTSQPGSRGRGGRQRSCSTDRRPSANFDISKTRHFAPDTNSEDDRQSWLHGKVILVKNKLCIEHTSEFTVQQLRFSANDVLGNTDIDEDDEVDFRINSRMKVTAVRLHDDSASSQHGNQSDDSSDPDDNAGFIRAKLLNRKSKHLTGKDASPSTDNAFSSEHGFVSDAEYLGKIVMARSGIAFVRPTRPLPRGYPEDKDVFVRLDQVKTAGINTDQLTGGDVIKFILGTKDTSRPAALRASVYKFRQRNDATIQTVLNTIYCSLSEASISDAHNQQSSTKYIVDLLSCAALWRCCGDLHTFQQETLCLLLNVVMKLNTEIRGLHQSFKVILRCLMESKMFNPLSNALKACIQRSIEDSNTELLGMLQEFYLLVFKFTPEKSRTVVVLIRSLIDTKNLQSREMFLWQSLKEISKSVGDSTLDLPWDDVPLTPTKEELLSAPDIDYMALTPITDTYKSAEEYYDVYFRLLRADCFDALRKGIQALLAGRLDPRDMNVYVPVSLAGVQVTTTDSGLSVVLQVKPHKEVKDWRTASNLMFGNLLCISPSGDFHDAIWATVANRDADLLSKKQLILIEFCTPCNTMSDSEAVIILSHSSGSMVMVESPSYYRAYYPVLRALQTAKTEQLPFQKELIRGEMDAIDDVPPYIADAEGLTQIKRATASTLDTYQSEAWDHVFKRRLACVQGPPGTGKTYIGTKIVQGILSMYDNYNTPVLVLTYKNHALDEFLKALLPIVPNGLVRVGSRCPDKSLSANNLNELSRSIRTDASIQKTIMETKDELTSMKKNVEHSMRKLSRSKLITTESLSKYLQPDQLTSLLSMTCGENAQGIANILKNHTDFPDEDVARAKSKLGHAFSHWCPPKPFIAEAEQTYSKMAAFEIRVASQEEKPNDEKDIFDEKDIEDLQKERMSGGSSRAMNKDDLIMFSNKTDLDPEIKLFNISKSFIARLPMLALANVSDVWSLSLHDRLKLLQCVLVQQSREQSEIFEEQLRLYQEICERKSELENQHKISILSSRKVIGMTITGASINQHLLNHVRPAIVIVEEAAEVLEAQILAILGPWVQHLILIGDHKQLRPQVESYTLTRDFHMDLSMMERMINNDIPCPTLNLQNRMRPEFAELLKDIYPRLESNIKRVSTNKQLEFMDKAMYFWTHSDPEKSGRSHTNEMEADKVVQLAVFMLQQGVSPNSITVIAAYQGQVGLLRRKFRDAENKWKSLFPPPHPDENVKNKIDVHTIDMFQGDENDVIIVSLVRSNNKGQMGFLKTLNRRCVAQSRARCGMYFVGNANTLVNSKHWNKLFSSMHAQGCTGDSIVVKCPKHPTSKESVKTSGDMPLTKPFCKVVCYEPLGCQKHRCLKPCKPPHEHNSCKENCSEVMSCGEHFCMKECFPFHEHSYCIEEVKYIRKSCNHEQVKQCSEKEEDLRCDAEVIFDFPCKHLGMKKCHQDQTTLKCREPCTKLLKTCGHLCARKCSEPCNENHCKTCERIRKEEELKKLQLEQQARELARDAAKQEYEKMSDQEGKIEVNILDNTGDASAEYNSIEDFIKNSFPHPVDHEVDVLKIEKITHVAAKKYWLKTKSEMYDAQQTANKILKATTEEVMRIAQTDFKIPLNEKGIYGKGVYVSSKLNDLGTDSTNGQMPLKALVADVLTGKSKTTNSVNPVALQTLHNLDFDSAYNSNVAIGNRYFADEFAVRKPDAVLPLYLVEYKVRRVSTKLNKLEDEYLKTNDSALKMYTIQHSREFDPNDVLQQEFRTAESQFHRLTSVIDKNVYKKTSMTSDKYLVESVDYFINPPLIKAFRKKEDEMKQKYGDSRESKRILAFHGTKPEHVSGIMENNFDLSKLAKATGDKGWYGAGIYLSEFPQTSVFYGEALILCKVLPGKPYDMDPHKDLAVGRDLQPGYDSHRVNKQDNDYGEELVLFNPHQVLPCYVIKYRKADEPGPAKQGSPKSKKAKTPQQPKPKAPPKPQPKLQLPPKLQLQPNPQLPPKPQLQPKPQIPPKLQFQPNLKP